MRALGRLYAAAAPQMVGGTRSMYEQTYSFTFEAAHALATSPPAQQKADTATGPHPYARLHGHSFVATIMLQSEELGGDHWVADFADVRAACDKVKNALDHQLLNEIDGLETPTLEVLSRWIYDRLASDFPAIAKVSVARPTLSESASFAAKR
ncbi:MAG: 6-carboxytetrahydropterin synthase [Parvularculaceae bacterium]|nr:MAG: 6-carboxytetrahydropterin synthase [Parvularculaceae bacterium]